MWHLLFLWVIIISSVNGKPRCGGLFTAARGILQTPGFPDDLPVPLQCEWVIDAQNLASPNTSIVVYLTQLYVHEGLSFTEYQVYDRTYQLDGRTIHVVNESNVAQIRWVQSFQNYLVVTLKIDDVDSTHLRVLDKFLNVFGFNITYEITRGPVRANPCTMVDCGFTGICYDHYTKFSCECFPGYSGPHCSSGTKSFCTNEQNPTCKNGATCMHVGVSAVKCHCQKGFTGDLCQIPINSNAKKDCNNCVATCTFNGKLDNACWCSNSINATVFTDRIGFTSRMHLSNLPNLKGDSIKSFIENQILRTLKMNYSKVEDVIVDGVTIYRSGADVTFHLFAMKKDEKRIKTILGKWSDRGYIANLTIAKEFVFRPLIDLQSVSINQAGTIREQDEFILSCVARGSPTMTFRWFKDGIFVNVTETMSHKWSRLIKDPHLEDQYTALLGVKRANLLDDGIFTCQVEDFHVQQCLSKRVRIKVPPIIKIEPMSRTVRKGENLTIKCLSIGDNSNKYTYSWTKNRELLPVRTLNEKYEILYPGGSILQVFQIEKSVKYSCLVQDEDISGEVTVNIHVIDPNIIKTCPNEKFLQLEWPETAPDTESLQECPKGYSNQGFIKRSCSLSNGPIWQLPDYSICISKFLHKLEQDFNLLRLGYETTTPSNLLKNCLDYLNNVTLNPGEAFHVLSLTKNILVYTKESHHIFNNITTVLAIVNKILMVKYSIINEEQIKLLQEVINDQIDQFASDLIKNEDHYNIFFPTIEINLSKTKNNLVRIVFNESNISLQQNFWIPTSANLFLSLQKNQSKMTSILGSVIYRNLTAFLPMRSVIRLKDGAEIEYEILSQFIRLWVIPDSKNDLISSLTIDWRHHFYNNSTREGWYIKCAVSTVVAFSFSWDITTCVTKSLNSSATRCVCPRTGTFAVLLTTSNIQVEKNETLPNQYIVLVGCSICLLSTIATSIILIIHWVVRHSYVTFLKIQCSLSITGIMVIFVLTSINEPSENLYANMMALLEILLLMGMSSHVSTLLIVYTELVELPKSKSTKEMVIGISTGVPAIAVFGNHLAHRTMDLRLKSWWLLFGSLAFNIFTTVTVVIVVLFLLLYIIIIRKLRKLVQIHDKHAKALQRRVLLLRRSACVFSSLVLATVSSILYINFLDSIWWHYEFSIAAVLLGFILIFCYIVKSETEFYQFFRNKLKNKTKNNFFGIESTGSPLNFFTKEEADMESESIPSSKPDIQRNSPKSGESYQMTDIHNKSRLPECIPGTNDMTCCEVFRDDLEYYNQSPKSRKNSSNYREETRCRSPDIIASKVCTQLDLVASHAPSVVNLTSPDEAISKILASSLPQIEEHELEEIESISTITNTNTISIKNDNLKNDDEDNDCKNGDKLDGMLDRISHDLDYLLNRSQDDSCSNSTPSVSANIRKISKPPALSVIEKIQEESEEEVKVPESITDILRTSC